MLIDSFFIKYRMIVVTNRRILVRHTIPAGEQSLKVNRRFFGDIATAGNALPAIT